MAKQIPEEAETVHLLGTELRDNIAAVITRIIPNIQWKQLSRLVAEFEVELSNLNDIQENE